MNPRAVIGVVFCLAAIGGSFVLSFDTWVSVGELAGFGGLALAMPLCVDGHVMTALTTWLSPVSERLARFARHNLYAIGAASVAAQSTYHGVTVWQVGHNVANTLIAVGAGAFPPVIATLAVHLAVSIVREAAAPDELEDVSPAEPEAAPVELEPVSPLSASEAPALPTLPPADPATASPPPAQPRRPAGRVTADDVAPHAGRERAEIAALLGTSVATVDRRLRELRDRQAVPA